MSVTSKPPSIIRFAQKPIYNDAKKGSVTNGGIPYPAYMAGKMPPMVIYPPSAPRQLLPSGYYSPPLRLPIVPAEQYASRLMYASDWAAKPPPQNLNLNNGSERSPPPGVSISNVRSMKDSPKPKMQSQSQSPIEIVVESTPKQRKRSSTGSSHSDAVSTSKRPRKLPQKGDKEYEIFRYKSNMACRKHRIKRRLEEKQMQEQLNELRVSNERLQQANIELLKEKREMTFSLHTGQRLPLMIEPTIISPPEPIQPKRERQRSYSSSDDDVDVVNNSQGKIRLRLDEDDLSETLAQIKNEVRELRADIEKLKAQRSVTTLEAIQKEIKQCVKLLAEEQVPLND